MDKTSQALKLQHEIHYSMKYIARIDTLQHENLLKGTNNLARSHKHSFIVFIPRLWPTILTNDTSNLLDSLHRKMCLFSHYKTSILKHMSWPELFTAMFKATPSNLTLFAPRRPYIQGEVRLPRVRQKIFDQTSKTETLNIVIQCMDKYFNLYIMFGQVF